MTVQDDLANAAVFQDLDEADLDALAPLCRTRLVRKGAVILYEDDPGTNCYVIASGRVKIVVPSGDRRDHIIGLLGPGDVFGEMALIDGQPRSARAVTLEPSRVVMIPRDDFLSVVEAHPSIGLKLLESLSQRLRATGRGLVELATLDAASRVAKLVLDLGQQLGTPTRRGLVLENPLNRSEMAALAGTSRETVARVMTDLQLRGLLAEDKQRIVIRNLAGLQARLDGDQGRP